MREVMGIRTDIVATHEFYSGIQSYSTRAVWKNSKRFFLKTPFEPLVPLDTQKISVYPPITRYNGKGRPSF